MSSFYHIDTPPQEFLNTLHSIDIPQLYAPALSREQRMNLIQYKRDQLKEWRSELNTEIKKIRQRYSKEEIEEARLALAPYQLLANLGKELSETIDTLEKALNSGRVLPQGFTFGSKIFGTAETGEWRLGEHADVNRWDEMVAIQQRLNTLLEEYKPLVRDMKLTVARGREVKNDARRLMSEYKKKNSALFYWPRLLIGILLVAGCIGAGWYLFSSETAVLGAGTDRIVGASALVLGVVFAIGLIVINRRRKRRLNQIKQDIELSRQRMAQLQQEAKDQRLHYYPINELVQDLSAQYKELRGTFR